MFRDGTWRDFDDVVSLEERVCIDGPDGRKTELWAHPVDLEQLVLGYAYAEWAAPILQCPRITSRSTEPATTAGKRGHAFSVEFITQVSPIVTPRALQMDGPSIFRASQAFIREKGLWDGSGCFHRASVFDSEHGRFVRRAEDIARHNCLDRLAGWALSEKMELANLVLFVSARVTSSLCVKAHKCGFRFIVSTSAVTSTALDLAIRNNMTLVGFCREREGRFTVFHGAGRVSYGIS